jgi:hypothetical protein
VKGWFRSHWGILILSLFSLLSLVRLLRQSVPGHYRVFTGAGRALWHGQNPYGTDFGTHVGYYFYSPTCALTVFGPLSTLPEKLGIVVFMVLSWLIFVWGAKNFWRSFVGERSPGMLQWFWAAITAQMVGGVLASKLEIAIAGILLGTIAWLKESAPELGRRGIAAAILLAAILNWKFQPVPVVGLLSLAWIIVWRDWKLPTAIAVALGGWYLLPYAFYSRDFLSGIHATWHSTFSKFVAESVLNFENIFAFLHNAFGIPLSFFATQITSGLVGVALACYVGLLARRSGSSRFGEPVLAATALGTMFMTVFSPLGQNNALILYAPLLLCAFIRLEAARGRRYWSWLIGVSVAAMTLLYSDLVPVPLRDEFRHLSLKPLACLFLGLAVALESYRNIQTTRHATRTYASTQAPQ